MNRVVLMAIILFIGLIWFSAFAASCGPGIGGGLFGPSWGAPTFIGGGGWNRGGWDRGSTPSSGGSSSQPSAPAGRSSGGSISGGGTRGGSGGK